jgi:hypothetical protein
VINSYDNFAESLWKSNGIFKKYFMEWDKFKIAQKFLQKANAIHPEDAAGSEPHARALALQDVNYDCYMSSFSREDLLKRLAEIINGNITMPEEEKVDEPRYRDVYITEAKAILSSIEGGQFNW